MSIDPIVLLTGEFPPLVGGVSSYLYQLVRNLPNHQVYVIALPTPGRKSFDKKQRFFVQRIKIPETWHPFYRQSKYLAPLYLLELLRVKHPGVVLCGHAHHALMLPAWIIHKLKKVPYGVFIHGSDVSRAQTRLYKGFFNYLLCQAQVVFANSRSTALIAKRIGLALDKVRIVHPPVDTEGLTKISSLESVTERHNLRGKQCILTVGRLVERKGHDIVLRALPTVLNNVPETCYLIVGSGPLETRLKAIVNSNDILKKHVVFAGQVGDELGSYYAACDVFVMVSRELPDKGDIEGFGIVYLEANLHGKPVVAGLSGGVSDAVIHEETGLLVNPNDPKEVARAILKLLNNKEFAHRLGGNGKTRVYQDFTGKVIAKKVEQELIALAKSFTPK